MVYALLYSEITSIAGLPGTGAGEVGPGVEPAGFMVNAPEAGVSPTLAVMVASPEDIIVTSPNSFTVAISSFEELKVK